MTISFRLSAPTPSLNETLRQHWATRKRRQAALTREIAWQVMRADILIEPALVVVKRYSSGVLDPDNAVGGLKDLIDCLKPRSPRNKHGLGLIAGDEPHRLTLIVEQIKCARAEQRTEVSIIREHENLRVGQ